MAVLNRIFVLAILFNIGINIIAQFDFEPSVSSMTVVRQEICLSTSHLATADSPAELLIENRSMVGLTYNPMTSFLTKFNFDYCAGIVRTAELVLQVHAEDLQSNKRSRAPPVTV